MALWKIWWKSLPPWERPGWIYGRGWCWYWRSSLPSPLRYPFPSREDEIRYLEDLKKYLTDVVLKDIDRRLEELKSGK